MPLKVPAYHLPGSSIPGGFQKLKLRSISVPAFEPVKINEQSIYFNFANMNFNVSESKLFWRNNYLNLPKVLKEGLKGIKIRPVYLKSTVS